MQEFSVIKRAQEHFYSIDVSILHGIEDVQSCIDQQNTKKTLEFTVRVQNSLWSLPSYFRYNESKKSDAPIG